LLAFATSTLVLGFATPAEAAHTYTVTGGSDSASGSCSPAFVCTDLRAAVVAANTDPGSTIDLGAATYQLGGGHGVAVGTGELRITQNLTIQGVGPSATQIAQTDGEHRDIDITGGTVLISGVEITGGNVVVAAGSSPGAEGAEAEGGGITNEGTLTLTNDAVVGNSVIGGAGAGNSSVGAGGPGGFGIGGGIFSRGALTVTNSTVSGNIATSGAGGATTGTGTGGTSHNADGGGIFESGALTITGSTISANAAVVGMPGTSSGGGATGAAGSANAGGINTQAHPASILNSTIADNIGTTPGGGYAVGGFETASTLTPVTLASDTFAGNGGFGATTTLVSNLLLESNTLTMAGTLLVAGTGGGVNCDLLSPTVNDDGHNLEDDGGGSCGLSVLSGDLVGANPLLMTLASNGGPTQTMALGQGSPAIDAGGNCLDITQPAPPPLASDQRGEPRANPCDIGAFESQPPSASSAPSIFGSAVEGQPLSCANGTWLGDLPLTFSTQWLRDGGAIAGGTGSAYVTTPADVGHRVSCAITATNIYGTQTAQSPQVIVGARAPSVAPAPPPTATATITGASETHRVWREGNKLAQITSKSKKKPPVGTTFLFSLNVSASVTFSFLRQVTGRKVGHKCVARTHKNAARKPCKYSVRAGTLSFTGHSGSNRVVFQGRISRSKELKPGQYTLEITASNAAGQNSLPQTLAFTIVK
jgi:hypothetical protein